MVICTNNVDALTIDNCKVLASYKLSSSLDEEKYICKDVDYGKKDDPIYYSQADNTIYLNNFVAYYFTDWEDYEVTINIKGTNTISLLQLNNSKIKVTGEGNLKFKQNSYVKKLVNGEAIYQYVYKDKLILNSDKKIYEGTLEDFEKNYALLQELNKLPEEYKEEDYEHKGVADYTKITPVIVTESWISQHIETTLDKSIEDGYGIIKYIAPTPEPTKKEDKEEKEKTKLETDNVILISEKKLQNKYKLKEKNLKHEDVANKVANEIDKDLISFYDVSVYNGKKEVPLKEGKYKIKIKIEGTSEDYENYQIIYVNDKGDIEEYINGTVEGEYIVFETTHLSQYGVIASPKVDNISVDINSESNNSFFSVANILKISILVVLALAAIILITIIILKNNITFRKSKKKKRA